MGRRPRVDRTPEEKWEIVQEGIKSGNVLSVVIMLGPERKISGFVRSFYRSSKLRRSKWSVIYL
jgi:hypothetical protein